MLSRWGKRFKSRLCIPDTLSVHMYEYIHTYMINRHVTFSHLRGSWTWLWPVFTPREVSLAWSMSAMERRACLSRLEMARVSPKKKGSIDTASEARLSLPHKS